MNLDRIPASQDSDGSLAGTPTFPLRKTYPDWETALTDASDEPPPPFRPVNVSHVKQFSPFRYPGGKTWLVPEVRRWMSSLEYRPSVFVEPFAGGASVGLTVAVENLADRVVLSELDPDVAAVWKVTFGPSDDWAIELFEKILRAELTEPYVRSIINSEPQTLVERAFQTIVKNRCQRSGILAPGAGLVKAGENGRGLLSRWYPETLVKRMTTLRGIRSRVEFIEGNAFDVIERHASNPTAAYLVDPPYSLGGKRAGARLYLHHHIDHERLFANLSNVAGKFLLTYDDVPPVVSLAERHGFNVARVPMKNGHHEVLHELLIQQTLLHRTAPDRGYRGPYHSMRL